MIENKLKHLEFIHNTINRMSANSFIIKGWLITIVSALFVFADLEKNRQFIIIAWMTVPTFWYINVLFLQQERKYRALYDKVRLLEADNIDFSMNTKEFKNGKFSVLSCFISKTIWPLYLIVFIIELMIIYCI